MEPLASWKGMVVQAIACQQFRGRQLPSSHDHCHLMSLLILYRQYSDITTNWHGMLVVLEEAVLIWDLVLEVRPMIHAVAREHRPGGMPDTDFADVVSELTMEAHRLAKAWNPERGRSWSSFAFLYLTKAVRSIYTAYSATGSVEGWAAYNRAALRQQRSTEANSGVCGENRPVRRFVLPELRSDGFPDQLPDHDETGFESDAGTDERFENVMGSIWDRGRARERQIAKRYGLLPPRSEQ